MKCWKCGGTGVYDLYNDCPYCDGTGEINDTEELEKKWENTVWDTDVYLDELDKMNDIEKRINKMIKKSEVILNAGKQTNDEWLRSCTTEELAEFIIGERKGCVYADCPNGETPCMSCKDGCDIDKLVEWLKQPHREE